MAYKVYTHPFAQDKTGEQVEAFNRGALGFWVESPVPHVFFVAWGSGRPGGLLQAVSAPTGEELVDYPCTDEPEIRAKQKALLEF